MSLLNVRKNVRSYSIPEEIANAITHGLGALLAIAGTVLLIVRASFTGDPWRIVSVSVYGFCMIVLFTMSTLYHSLTNIRAKKVFRVFDHTSIFLLIAGTYTPLTLVTLRGAVGFSLFGVIWAAGITGIVLNSISVDKFHKFSQICYLAMGWCGLLLVYPMIKAVPSAALIMIALGGVFYTVGVLFYRKKSVLFMHSIWHVFVLAGAVIHWFAIYLYVAA